MQHSIICTLSLSHFKIQLCQLSHLSNTLARKLPHTLHAIFIHTFFKATISHQYMDKMNGSSLGKQCQNSLPPPCPLPPPHLISTTYKDILWSSYLLVPNYMQATSAQAGQLSVKFFEIVHSIHCTTQNTRYWNLNNSMNVVIETDRKQISWVLSVTAI